MNRKEFDKLFLHTALFIFFANFVTLFASNFNLFVACWSVSVGIVAITYILQKVGMREV